jgi:hypothetical protein
VAGFFADDARGVAGFFAGDARGVAGFFADGVRGDAGFFDAARGVAGFFSVAAAGSAEVGSSAARGAAGFFAAVVLGVAGFFAAGTRGLRGAEAVEAFRGAVARGVAFFACGVSSEDPASEPSADGTESPTAGRGVFGRGRGAEEVSTLAASSSDPAEADSGGCGSDAVIAPNYQPPPTPTRSGAASGEIAGHHESTTTRADSAPSQAISLA